MSLPDLPAGWVWTTVEQAGRLQLGRQRAPRYHTGSNMKPYLRVANVFEDRIDTTDVKQMHFEPEEFERYRLVPGDVLLNEGQTPELLGRPAVYRGEPQDCGFTNSLIRFRAGPGVLPEWAFMVFRAHMHSGRFARESRITTNIAHLSLARLRGVEMPVPSLDEQRRFVSALQDHLSRLDAAHASLSRGARRGSRLSSSVAESALLPAVDLTVGAAKSRVVEDAGSLPGLSAGWHWSRLGDLAEVVGGITKDASKQSSDGLVEVPYLRVANVQRGRLDLTTLKTIRAPASKVEQLRLRQGDVLLNEGGDRDKLGRGWVWTEGPDPCIHQNHVYRGPHRRTDASSTAVLVGEYCRR